VYAKATTTATYGDDIPSTAEQKIKQYFNPNAPGKPALTNGSFKNGRLTTKQNWTYSWTGTGSPNKTTSPVKGYRIRLYKNDVNIPIKNNSGTVISSVLGSTDHFYDSESTSTSFTINPTIHGFKPGDSVQLSIYSYTRWGKEADKDNSGKLPQRFNGGGTTASRVLSDKSVVQNAGVVRVKVNNAWKEGQVWVKVGGVWKEAETVNVKVNGTWRESQ
jgi:hypothetical protein